jgi:hypothetical protein
MWCNDGFGQLDGKQFTPLPGPSRTLDGDLAAAW